MKMTVRPPASSGTRQTAYVPGVYSAALTLGSEQVNVEVAVDSRPASGAVALVPLKRGRQPPCIR